jgi:GNAT superfamily N-acetyltransferase
VREVHQPASLTARRGRRPSFGDRVIRWSVRACRPGERRLLASATALTAAGMHWRIEVAQTPGAEERAAVLAPLAAFNAENGYPADTRTLAVLLKDAHGRTIGGLWGQTGYGWMFVEFLAVPDSLRGRGIGAALMTAGEKVARERGCVGAWLTTFSFQARGFYEKLGYAPFGELENSPGENVRLFMRKRFGR